MFLSDILKDEIQNWLNQIILIDAPTGSGKTTLVITLLMEHFLRYETISKRKALILCNRRLLRKQYWGSIIQKYQRYADIEKTVTIKTYQELSVEILDKASVDDIFNEYCIVVCDECHYFYADSDFNSLGTYPLLHAIIRAGFSLPLVLLTATAKEVLPLIKNTIEEQEFLSQNERLEDVKPKHPDWNLISELSRPLGGFKLLRYTFPELHDYTRFKCFAVSDEETLSQTIADSEGKSIIFIDNRRQAELLVDILINNGINKQDIATLNSDNIDSPEMSYVVDPLVMTNRLSVRVLLTTSVLDNGVSVHDPDVDTVVIVTDSEISFLQMLGRIRADKEGKEIRLVFLVRESGVFRERAERYKKMEEVIADIKDHHKSYSALRIISSFWNDSDPLVQEYYRKLFCPVRPDNKYLPDDRDRRITVDDMALQIRGHETGFYLNRFAVEKIGNMMIEEERFYQAALIDPLNVIYSQMAWIGKKPEELQLVESVVEKEFVEELLKIDGYDHDQLKKAKEGIIKRFKHSMLKDVDTRNGSIGKDKFDKKLKEVGLKLIIKDGDDRKHRYYIVHEDP